MRKNLIFVLVTLVIVVLAGCVGIFTVKTESNNISLPLTGIQNYSTNLQFRFFILKRMNMEEESVSVIASRWEYIARSDTPVTFQIKITDENITDSTDYLIVFDTTGLNNYIPSFILQPFLSGMRALGYKFDLPAVVNRAPVLISGSVDGLVSSSVEGNSSLNATLERALNKGQMWVIVSVQARSNYFPPVSSPSYLILEKLTGHIDVEVDMSPFSSLFYLTF